LNHINLTLREQLDQATIANQKLSQEIQKVNHEWIRLREQLENREREWRDEENVF
jgi:rootletin